MKPDNRFHSLKGSPSKTESREAYQSSMNTIDRSKVIDRLTQPTNKLRAARSMRNLGTNGSNNDEQSTSRPEFRITPVW